MPIFTPRSGIRHLPQNLLLAAEKDAKLPVFATFMSRSGFFWAPL